MLGGLESHPASRQAPQRCLPSLSALCRADCVYLLLARRVRAHEWIKGSRARPTCVRTCRCPWSQAWHDQLQEFPRASASVEAMHKTMCRRARCESVPSSRIFHAYPAMPPQEPATASRAGGGRRECPVRTREDLCDTLGL